MNWRNLDVRAAIADVMRFWLDRGVDGFRVDASAVLVKDDLLRDNPPDPEGKDKPPPQRFTPVFTDDRPETMQCIEFLREVIDGYEGRLLCGEVQGKIDRIGHFYGIKRPRLHLPLNFALLDSPWDALALQATIEAYFNALPENAWPVWVIGGHDKPRIASKVGQEQMRMLAMLLMTLKGTPFFYMGDEIGRERVHIPPDLLMDIGTEELSHLEVVGSLARLHLAPSKFDRQAAEADPLIAIAGGGGAALGDAERGRPWLFSS